MVSYEGMLWSFNEGFDESYPIQVYDPNTEEWHLLDDALSYETISDKSGLKKTGCVLNNVVVFKYN